MYHDPNAGMPPPVPAAGYAYGVAPAVGQPAQYIYKGQRYGDLKQLQAAMQSSPLPTAKSSWVQLLRDKVALEKKVKELFHQYSGADRKLQPHEVRSADAEVHGLAFSLGAQLGIDPTAFGDIQVLFHRYDFSGDGELDESEALHLITHMLRVFRDGLQRQQQQSQALPMQPVPDFSAESIPFKQLDQAFVLQKKLGQGGQGAVYLATDRSSKLKRVVKFYNKSCANAPVEDIVEEFNLLTSLDHPKIARLYEVFQDHVYIYVVSEPYFGGDLTTCAQKATERGVALNQSWLAGILKQICATRLQERNVVVIDFGLARDFRKGSSGVMGTPGYMPPEDRFVMMSVFRINALQGLREYVRFIFSSQRRRAFEGQTVQQLQVLVYILSEDRPMVSQDASSPVSKEAIADLGQFKPMPPSDSRITILEVSFGTGRFFACWTTQLAPTIWLEPLLYFLRDPSRLICLRLVSSSELGRVAYNVLDQSTACTWMCSRLKMVLQSGAHPGDIVRVDTYQDDCPILVRLHSKRIWQSETGSAASWFKSFDGIVLSAVGIGSNKETRDRAVHLSLATALTLELPCRQARQIKERTDEELPPPPPLPPTSTNEECYDFARQFMVFHENPNLWFSVGRIGGENGKLGELLSSEWLAPALQGCRFLAQFTRNVEDADHLRITGNQAQLDADHSGVVTEPEARKDSESGAVGSSGTLTYSRFMAEMISAKKVEECLNSCDSFYEEGRRIPFGPHMLGISFLKGLGCLVAHRLRMTKFCGLACEPENLRGPRWRIFKELDADNSNSLDANEIKVTFWDFKRALEMMDMTRSRAASSGARTPLYAEGDKVQYFSATYAQWMDTMITAVAAAVGKITEFVPQGRGARVSLGLIRLRAENPGKIVLKRLLGSPSHRALVPAMLREPGHRDRQGHEIAKKVALQVGTVLRALHTECV
ncbi:CPK1 [Symbiodinium sp. CCMP2456]|nr:CPK1 [Symbiodinium sp. CCMP2456]